MGVQRKYGQTSSFASRKPLIDSLPEDTIWQKVEITKQNLLALRLINDLSWNDLSFFSGEIPLAITNLEYYWKCPLKLPHFVLPDGVTRQQYFDRLLWSLSAFRRKNSCAGNNLTLILLSSNRNGPFTILEGNHTAVALYFRYFIDQPQIVYPTQQPYVGISPRMYTDQFYHVI